MEQLAYADCILLNKIDLIEDDDSIKDTEAELQGIERRIKAINGAAQIFRCKQSNVEPKNVIGLDAFSLDRGLKMVARKRTQTSNMITHVRDAHVCQYSRLDACMTYLI